MRTSGRRKVGARWWTRLSVVCWLATVLLSTAPSAGARPGAASEYGVKAVFLFNFASFVEWPPTAFPVPEAPFVIGVVGEDPFGAILDEVVANETVDGRSLVVRRFRRLEEVRDCQILFISRSEAPSLRDVLAHLRGQPVLTVGDMPAFAEAGGMISFASEGGRLRLSINTEAVRSARLAVSAKLLDLARVVGPPTG